MMPSSSRRPEVFSLVEPREEIWDGTAEKDALVTGSTDGVGRLVTRKLGQAGAHVLVHGRDAERGARVLGDTEASGVRRISLRPTSRRSPRCVAFARENTMMDIGAVHLAPQDGGAPTALA
jgi:NAD(P)-dependent dehydrogenase (short-subunit alcohol dehydrogenase family)